MSIILDGTTGITSPAIDLTTPLSAADGGTGLSSVGTAGNTLFTTNGTTWSSTAKIVQGSVVTLTTQTSVDFTSIPSWVKRITVMFTGVSTNGTSNPLIQIGAGSVTTTGYVSYGAQCGGSANTTNGTTSTIGMVIIRNNAADTYNGIITISNITSNTWVSSHSLGGLWAGTLNAGYVGGGNVALGGALDRIRITTVNGTDTFDAGSVNILYE